MADKTPENLKVTDQGTEKCAQKSAEPARDSVISGESSQHVHGKAFELLHKDDKHPSGVMPALHESFGITGDLTASDISKKEKRPAKKVSIDPRPSFVEGLKAVGEDEEARAQFQLDYMERKAQEALAQVQKTDSEKGLIASNKAPSGPNLEHMQQFDEIQSDSANQVIAWDPREQLKEWGKGLDKTSRKVKQVGAEVSAELTKDGSMLDKPSHPYKDNPDQLMDYNACYKAWKHFPVFARHPNLDAALLPAIIRNEVRSLRVDDKYLWNPSAEHGWGLEKDRTIGPANMKTENIDLLVKKYHQIVDPELGGIDPKHAYRDALKPEKAAWLAAAYLANEAEKMETSGQKSITHRDLIKSYNEHADLDFQFKRIHEQLIYVKQNHPLFRDE